LKKISLLACVLIVSRLTGSVGRTDWPEYQGGADRSQYSPLRQVHVGNVAELRPVWEYRTGELGEMQCNPLVIGGTLYGVTATGGVFALDAVTGRELWTHRIEGPATGAGWQDRLRILRGVTHWTDGREQRIFFTAGSWLHALDAATGRVIEDFGKAGRVSLKSGLGAEAQAKWVVSSTPGALFEDLIIMPTRVTENEHAAPGHIQAFDVRTGRLVWVFRTIPEPGDPGRETWPEDFVSGGANCWAGMTVDRERGMVFVPTGSATPDFWGGDRPGRNLYANTLLALEARTGRRIWHFQFVRHDIWDRDLSSPPNLVTVRRGDRLIDAVAQVTKTGHVFVFNRDTGEPLFSLEEVPAPPSPLAGEWTYPTQPLPVLPKPFSRQTLSDDDINPYAPNREELLARLRAARRGPFMPFSVEDTVFFPGYDGGASWGGAAVAPDGVLYINAINMAWIARLKNTLTNQELAALDPGQRLYALNCAACHGAGREGNPGANLPPLTDLSARWRADELANLIISGRGMMPGFPQLSADDRATLVAHLLGDHSAMAESRPATPPTSATGPQRPPYVLDGYVRFLDADRYPAITPPWGTLTAIDLNSGEHLWQVPLGEHRELTARGIPQTGTENYGGPVVTAGGLVFIAATRDERIRAFDKKSGALLWEHKLPASGFATPSLYEVDGRQFVVIAAGGTKLGTPKGEHYVAFALP
jgi:quinoprotein glucose dehydrogenase